MTSPELANLSFLKQIEAALTLRRRLRGEYHPVSPGAHQAGESSHGCRGGAQNSGFSVEDSRREVIGNVVVMAKDTAVLHAHMLDHLLLERRLVQRLFLEANGKGLEWRGRVAADQGHQRRGI